MRPPSTLALHGPATFRSPSSLPSNVCVFCLQQSLRPFSTTASRSIDMKRKYRNEQTERQRLYMEKNKLWLTKRQLLPRLRHEAKVEWEQLVKDAKRKRLPKPDFEAWRDERSNRLHEEKEEGPQEAQQEVDVALKEVVYPRPTTWDGMEMVGGETEWNTGAKFKGYLPQAKLSRNAEITAAMYRAVVELFTAMAHGKDLMEVGHPRNPRLYNKDISQVRVKVAEGQEIESGQVEINLEYPSKEAEQRIYRAITLSTNEVGPDRPNKILQRGLLEELAESWGSDWLRISLADPDIKMAMVRRLTALLGKPIPDLVIHTNNTVGSLLNKLVQPPPATKLHQALVSDKGLRSLQNISLLAKRDALVKKETRLGRWKVIRSALRAKGLPVLHRVTGWEHEQRQRRRESRAQRDSDDDISEISQDQFKMMSRDASKVVSEVVSADEVPESLRVRPEIKKSEADLPPPRPKWREWLGM